MFIQHRVGRYAGVDVTVRQHIDIGLCKQSRRKFTKAGRSDCRNPLAGFSPTRSMLWILKLEFILAGNVIRDTIDYVIFNYAR